jgi:hypothetical protein
LDDDATNDSSTLLGYNLYRSDDNKLTYNKLNADLITDTNISDHVPAYKEYWYYVTSIFQTNGFMTCESDSSNIVCPEGLIVKDNLNVGRISIHPNPARENVIVSSDFTISGIELFNYTGQPVFARQNVNEKTIMVNVSALEPGIYLIRITTGKEISTTKITVAH